MNQLLVISTVQGMLLSAGFLFCFVTGMWFSRSRYKRALQKMSAALKEAGDPEGALAIDSIDSGLPDIDIEIGERIAPLFLKIGLLEEERDLAAERYRTLTDNLAAAVVIRDAQSKISYCSPYTEVLTGFALSEVYDSQEDFFLSRVHEADREMYFRALKVSAFGEPFQFRYRFYHKTGIEMWAETRTVPILDENENVVSSLSITIDVTGSVRYQRQVEEKNRDLQDFTYMVSHDLKAPIFTIKGMLGIISEDYRGELDPAFQELLGHMKEAADRLEQLVASVLEYSRIGSQEIQMGSVSLDEVFHEVLNDYTSQIQESGAAIEMATHLPNVEGDRVRVYQIFSNLVGNAIKYRDPERPLAIRVWAREDSGKRSVTVSIADNGLGIDEDKLDIIFRPFARAHATQVEGSGIGLACVKRLCDRLGGEVSVESVPGGGSTFTVTLRRSSGVEKDSHP